VGTVRKYAEITLQLIYNASQTLERCDFVNSALKIQCHIVKNTTLLKTAFLAIFPTGMISRHLKSPPMIT